MSQETILVVDDNLEVAQYLSEEALPRMGYKSLIARDGKGALKFLRGNNNKIDLMVLDLQLPDIDGIELLHMLDMEGRSIPTILFTAHGSEQVAVEAFRLGVHDYLHKPVDVDQLNSAISRALSESRLRREKDMLTAKLQEQVTFLTALSKVGRSVTSTLDLDELLRRIVEAGVYLTRADEGFLALLDEGSDQLYLRAVKNIDEDTIKTLRLLVTDSLVGSVMNTGRPLRANQESKELLKVSTGYLVNSLVHVPLLSKGKALGVLSVNNRGSKHTFTEHDETVLSSLADYAAIALENANLYQRAQMEISERMRIEAALRESQERYEIAERGANDGLWDWDLKADKIYYSPRWKAMLGYREDEIKETPDEWFDRVHPDDITQARLSLDDHVKGETSHLETEFRIRHKDESYRWMLCRGIAVWDKVGTAYRIAGSMSDITDRKQAEQKLIQSAFFDDLTGLPNRALFVEHLNHSIERTKRNPEFMYAVLFLDIDRFKDINDSLGHLTGDELLIATARRLQEIMRPTDTVARLGGDEFVILLEDIRDFKDATLIADRVQNELHAASLLPEHTLFITISTGIVLSVTGYEHAEDVLRDADIAMYRAKANGRARYEIFDSTMRDRILKRLALESELRMAFEHNELRVHYQPIVSLVTKEIIGFEALVRWQHPRRGLLYPAEFIPLAEETGLIILIDRWVMRQACQQMSVWHVHYPSDPPLVISVNLSGKQVMQPDLISEIDRILKETGMQAPYLHLELTESIVMENFELTVEVLSKLRKLGVKIQIDDFGIGYSSLNYLSRFPINALKIDRSFINLMTDDPNHMKIVQAIVRLSHGLGMDVVAEGVETENQWESLKELECEYMQGALVSMPVDVETVRTSIKIPGREGKFFYWGEDGPKLFASEQ
jgi:diguanylate cyclase (GGDEF)-like protein/PAS domain S-box-containing protein